MTSPSPKNEDLNRNGAGEGPPTKSKINEVDKSKNGNKLLPNASTKEHMGITSSEGILGDALLGCEMFDFYTLREKSARTRKPEEPGAEKGENTANVSPAKGSETKFGADVSSGLKRNGDTGGSSVNPSESPSHAQVDYLKTFPRSPRKSRHPAASKSIPFFFYSRNEALEEGSAKSEWVQNFEKSAENQFDLFALEGSNPLSAVQLARCKKLMALAEESFPVECNRLKENLNQTNATMWSNATKTRFPTLIPRRFRGHLPPGSEGVMPIESVYDPDDLTGRAVIAMAERDDESVRRMVSTACQNHTRTDKHTSQNAKYFTWSLVALMALKLIKTHWLSFSAA